MFFVPSIKTLVGIPGYIDSLVFVFSLLSRIRRAKLRSLSYKAAPGGTGLLVRPVSAHIPVSGAEAYSE